VRSASQPREVADDLNQIFRAGDSPKGLDGRCEGILVMTTQGPLDGVARSLSSLWMPWLGKRFDRAAATGDNLMTAGASRVARLAWPTYAFRPVEPAVLSAFDFRTYVEPGLADPDRPVLKIDYDLDVNPRFLIRDILDELMEVGRDTYLGKVHMRKGGGWKMMGYFALRADPASRGRQEELTVWKSEEVAEEPKPATQRRRRRTPRAETAPE
jgi:hypothetical protein